MPIARAPSDKELDALAEEGDDAVGQLAEERGVEPVDHERTVAADPFEAFTRRAFRGRFDGIDEDGRDEF
jgi:hypothetical protein